jgi:ABC-type spermidine/putrescine transport system permease subunit II
MPQEGMFVFIIPYVLILIANRFIKKDESLVQSADRLR